MLIDELDDVAVGWYAKIGPIAQRMLIETVERNGKHSIPAVASKTCEFISIWELRVPKQLERLSSGDKGDDKGRQGVADLLEEWVAGRMHERRLERLADYARFYAEASRTFGWDECKVFDVFPMLWD